MKLGTNVKVTLVQAALADGQTDPDSVALDMQGFDGVLFIGIAGTVTGSGTATLKVSDSSDNSSFSDISGVTQVVNGSAKSDKFVVLDVFKPLKRYIRTTLTRATANSVWGGTIAIQYNAKARPTTHDATTLAAAMVSSVGGTS